MCFQESIEAKRHNAAVGWTGIMNQHAPSVPSRCPRPTLTGVSIDASPGPASYARMFPDLVSFRCDDEFLQALGRAGGICDCGDIDDSPDSLSDTAAGWPIFGQFVAHDITADRSTLRSHTNVEELHNARSPRLNLECLYGDGPIGHPFLMGFLLLWRLPAAGKPQAAAAYSG